MVNGTKSSDLLVVSGFLKVLYLFLYILIQTPGPEDYILVQQDINAVFE